MNKSISLLITAITWTLPSLFSNPALAFPTIRPSMTQQTLPASFNAGYDFEGIVALSNCSGSLVQLENGHDSDLGLILTNGHCLEGGFPAPGAVVYGRASKRSFTLLNAQGKDAGKVTATKIIFSTMTKTDMTIYQLKETYAEIKSKTGIRPLTLASRHPAIGTAMEVISGYWRRGYSCQVDNFIFQLREDRWTMVDSVRYSSPGCETIGGTSGSPIVEARTRTVIGVNNTGNESGEKCTMNNPCEVDAQGNITAKRGASYGQQTFWVYTCLNANREIDISLQGCLLPSGK